MLSVATLGCISSQHAEPSERDSRAKLVAEEETQPTDVEAKLLSNLCLGRVPSLSPPSEPTSYSQAPPPQPDIPTLSPHAASNPDKEMAFYARKVPYMVMSAPPTIQSYDADALMGWSAAEPTETHADALMGWSAAEPTETHADALMEASAPEPTETHAVADTSPKTLSVPSDSPQVSQLVIAAAHDESVMVRGTRGRRYAIAEAEDVFPSIFYWFAPRGQGVT
ncbi:hypothetical protein FA95DRAFT_904553 [Auriscalpium vulgare]|uniref:Uncharacterized protein n=1 Tax=Auriscalpium vulgare TaxID=40419 RepID=A0ACB8R8K2_9AGAM|nr:hypothetical protein FA95DRAFT_904553 [Auriscalpium vulgare]